MYGLIRLLIGCLVFCCVILVARKSKATHKRKVIVCCVVVTVIFITILAFIPFENLFITFKSPEDVFKYYNGSNRNVNLVVKGKESDLVIGENKKTDVYLIVPKADDGWEIGTGINTKRIIQKIYNGITVYVYQYKDTNDYFVIIFDTNGGGSQITDSCNSKFSSLEKTNTSLGKTYITYYANIQDFTQQYWININGEEITINKTGDGLREP